MVCLDVLDDGIQAWIRVAGFGGWQGEWRDGWSRGIGRKGLGGRRRRRVCRHGWNGFRLSIWYVSLGGSWRTVLDIAFDRDPSTVVG
jgi:hypothetical protein